MGSGWHVCVFFIVAGFFLKEDSLMRPITFVKKKLKRLYLPATIIYSLSIIFHNEFVKIGWYPIGGIHPGNGIPFEIYSIKEISLRILKVLLGGGSGELVMGAMWFLYTLLYAFVGMTSIYWLLSFMCKSKEKRFYWMTIILLLLAIASCTLTHNDITLNRISPTFTVMFLIWWGMILNRQFQWRYDNVCFLLIAILVFIHCITMQHGNPNMAKNKYQDLLHLVIGGSACIYFWGFIGKKIANTFVGKALALLGRESLYLMAFHILGLFVCNSLLLYLGFFSIGDEKGMYTYSIGNNYMILLLYVFCAVSVSLGLLYLWRLTRNITLAIIGLRMKL